MRILCIGDIMGSPGRKIVKTLLPSLKKEQKIDFVIANGENMAHGKGMTKKQIQEMQKTGVDFFTGGNHSFANNEYYKELDKVDTPVIRPLNFPDIAPGRGYQIIKTSKGSILIINAMGQVYMNPQLDSPFLTIEKVLQKYEKQNLEAIIIDFHAETTAEKYCLRHYLNQRNTKHSLQVSLLFGTHTHVPTADCHITPSHMGYITDLGMTGAVDSSIGVQADIMVQKILTRLPAKNEIEKQKPYYMRALLVEIFDQKCESIELLQLKT